MRKDTFSEQAVFLVIEFMRLISSPIVEIRSLCEWLRQSDIRRRKLFDGMFFNELGFLLPVISIRKITPMEYTSLPCWSGSPEYISGEAKNWVPMGGRFPSSKLPHSFCRWQDSMHRRDINPRICRNRHTHPAGLSCFRLQ